MSDTELTLTTPDGPMGCYEVTPEAAPRGCSDRHPGGVRGERAHPRCDTTVRCRGLPRGRAGDVPPRRWRHRRLRRLRRRDPAVRRRDRRRRSSPTSTRPPTTFEASGSRTARIGIVGFCFGGRVTFLVAARRALGAAVGFYGGGIANKGALPFDALIGEASGLQTPWLGLFGDEDAVDPGRRRRGHPHRARGGTRADRRRPIRRRPTRLPLRREARQLTTPRRPPTRGARALTWFDAHLATS